MRSPSTKDLRLNLALNKCQFKDLPAAFQFGFNAMSLLFYWHRNGRSSMPSLLSMGSSISDTMGEAYSDDFELFKSQYIEESRKYIEDASFFYNESITKPVDIIQVIDLLVNPREGISFPIVGFNALKNYTSLQTLAATLLGKDHESVEKMVAFRRDPSRIIDLSKVFLKLNIGNIRNIDYRQAVQLLPTTEFMAPHPCLETTIVRETFNQAVHAGIAKGCFADFSSMVSWLQTPEIITTMYFGKHEGTPLPKLPRSYTNYLLESSWMFEDEHSDLLYSLRNIDLVQKTIEAAK